MESQMLIWNMQLQRTQSKSCGYVMIQENVTKSTRDGYGYTLQYIGAISSICPEINKPICCGILTEICRKCFGDMV